MNKILLTLMLIMLVIPMASTIQEQTDLGTFQKDTTIELFQSCPTCTYVNLTIIRHPNGTIETINQAMTKEGFNYFYDYNNANQSGEYFYTLIGDKDGNLETETIKFTVTNTGSRLAQQDSNIIIAVFSLLIIVSLFFSWLAFKMNNNIVQIGFLAFSLLLVVFNIGLGVSIVDNQLIGFSNISNSIGNVYYGFIYLGIAGMIGLLIWMIIMGLKVYKLRRGLSMEGSEDY